MRSFNYRNSNDFLRISYNTTGFLNIPVIKRQEINESNIEYISFDKIKYRDNKTNKSKYVHFFDCYPLLLEPYINIHQFDKRLFQYSAIFTPYVKIDENTPKWEIITNTAMSRWCGNQWQNSNCKVITSVSWLDLNTYDICFSGIEKYSSVAVSCLDYEDRDIFLNGYEHLYRKIEPQYVFCYGKPLKEMVGNIIEISVVNNKEDN